MNARNTSPNDRLQNIEASARELRGRMAPGALLLSDTRSLTDGDWLIARPSARTPLTTLLALAQESHAAGVVIDAQHAAEAEAWLSRPLPQRLPNAATLLHSVEDLHDHLGYFAAAFYNHPSQDLAVVAVTGTNGKSSIAQAHASAWQALGEASATIGTLGPRVFGAQLPADHRLLRGSGLSLTTPDAVALQALMRLLVDLGVRHLALEASSIGLVQGRLQGTSLRAVALSSLGHDHLDFHKTLEAYDSAKALLFEMAPGACIAAGIGERAQRFRDIAHRRGTALLDFALPATADALDLDWAALPPMLGQVNRENRQILAGLLWLEGLRGGALQKAVAAYRLPEGRFQEIPSNRSSAPRVWVDYAHTPDALAAVCQAGREAIEATPGARLILVFGCGGDRDADKRPKMAALATEQADATIITSDNPRSEEPEAIVAQMLAGLGPQHRQPMVVLDRAQAIRAAIRMARPQDLVVIAGKGHEKTQSLRDTTIPFSDATEAQRHLAAWLPPIALGDATFAEISTDTRRIEAGALFVALRGDRHDAHDHIAAAIKAGARGLVVEISRAEAVERLRAGGIAEAEIGSLVIHSVPSTLAELCALAGRWRQKWSGQMAVVVGSNGKTTTKEMLAHIARTALGDAHVCATQGNLNNQVGLPLSLLQLTAEHQIAVMEIGMNHPGEIAALAQAAAPEVVVMTNAQREHLEFMQTVAQCAQENGTALLALPPPSQGHGLAVLPQDPEHLPIWLGQLAGRPHRIFSVGSCSASLPTTVQLPNLPQPIRLRGLGQHFAENAAAAALAAEALGLPALAIAEALESFEPVAGRGRLRWTDGLTLVDDTYNANPDSMTAALQTLHAVRRPAGQGTAVAVLGDMGELGDASDRGHAEVLAQALALRLDLLALAGDAFGKALAASPASSSASLSALSSAPSSSTTEVIWAPSAEALAPRLAQSLQHLRSQGPMLIWLKGSRFMRMEGLIPTAMAAHPSERVARESHNTQSPSHAS